MKKTIHILLIILLIAGLSATAQIQRGNKKPSKPKTEKPAKTQSGNSTSSKKKKTQKTKSSSNSQSSSSSHSNSATSTQSAAPATRPNVPKIEIITVKGVTFEMIWVVGGTFTMGATNEQGIDAESDERPAHQVTQSSYYIGKYEVTQELWQAVMGKNPSEFKGDARRPVESVSWDDCQEFIKKLNKLTGRQFRLPTEAEWEYAARGGSQSRGYKYAGSNNLDNVAWYYFNIGSKTTHPVGQKSPNELGLYDMSGNVCEWCQDWYGSYSSSSQTDPLGASSGSTRVYRGGGWNNGARYCRVSFRNIYYPSLTFNYLGLRLAL